MRSMNKDNAKKEYENKDKNINKDSDLNKDSDIDRVNNVNKDNAEKEDNFKDKNINKDRNKYLVDSINKADNTYGNFEVFEDDETELLKILNNVDCDDIIDRYEKNSDSKENKELCNGCIGTENIKSYVLKNYKSDNDEGTNHSSDYSCGDNLDNGHYKEPVDKTKSKINRNNRFFKACACILIVIISVGGVSYALKDNILNIFVPFQKNDYEKIEKYNFVPPNNFVSLYDYKFKVNGVLLDGDEVIVSLIALDKNKDTSSTDNDLNKEKNKNKDLNKEKNKNNDSNKEKNKNNDSNKEDKRDKRHKDILDDLSGYRIECFIDGKKCGDSSGRMINDNNGADIIKYFKIPKGVDTNKKQNVVIRIVHEDRNVDYTKIKTEKEYESTLKHKDISFEAIFKNLKATEIIRYGEKVYRDRDVSVKIDKMVVNPYKISLYLTYKVYNYNKYKLMFMKYTGRKNNVNKGDITKYPIYIHSYSHIYLDGKTFDVDSGEDLGEYVDNNVYTYKTKQIYISDTSSEVNNSDAYNNYNSLKTRLGYALYLSTTDKNSEEGLVKMIKENILEINYEFKK